MMKIDCEVTKNQFLTKADILSRYSTLKMTRISKLRSGDEHPAAPRPHGLPPPRHGGEQVSKYSFSLKFRASSTFPPQANLRHANLSNDEKKSEGDDFAAADKAEAEEARRSVFATNYRLGKTCHAIVLGNKSQLSKM